MNVICSYQYTLDLGAHPWNTAKYKAVVSMLRENASGTTLSFLDAPMAEDEDILKVHTMSFWKKLVRTCFSAEEEQLLELPITSDTVNLFWRMAGGTVLATEQALRDGICVHIGGGFHHAFPDYGTGFCLINDIAVGLRSVMHRGLAHRTVVVDCDLHQGDGTAWIFRDDDDVATFSIHQSHQFPYFMQQSTIDIGLEDGTRDEVYLDQLEKGLDHLFNEYGPFDLLHYQARADPYEGDTLGGFLLTESALKRRDEMVLERAAACGLPAVVTLGGGYTRDLADLARIHHNTILTALTMATKYR